MDALSKLRYLAAFIVLFWLGQAAAPSSPAVQDLHAQSAAAALARDFNDPDLSFLLLAQNGEVMAQRWGHPERDIPVGSLLKPLQAVAYGRTHRTFPVYRCIGKKTCWLPRGHGTLHIREAIAFSCNSYFHQLVADGGPDFAAAMNHFQIHAAGPSAKPSSPPIAAPLALARAYLALANNTQDRAVAPVLQGMALSAQKGTGRAAGAALPDIAILAKTGTAPCTHARKAPGDGFALLMVPAEHAREVLLVRVHGHPGAVAAGVAGRMIAAIESIGQRR